MTLGEFRKTTAHLPDTIDMFMGERITDFQYGLVGSAEVGEINMCEDPDSKPLAKETVLIIEETN